MGWWRDQPTRQPAQAYKRLLAQALKRAESACASRWTLLPDAASRRYDYLADIAAGSLNGARRLPACQKGAQRNRISCRQPIFVLSSVSVVSEQQLCLITLSTTAGVARQKG